MKVAGYCRVSTDHEDQVNSFESQQQYFREYITRQKGWELSEIYADEGISGTGTKKRSQFNRMIQDAYAGKFQLILTKEVSRFSRNILDTIFYTRQLRSIGVGVHFLTDGINTLAPDGEMLLSFLASLAQEESRRTSARVVWGQTRQMERGIVFGRSLLGYDVKDGHISVNPEEAHIVRLIFHKYTNEQLGTREIARYLKDNHYKTRQGTEDWHSTTIGKILKNEKYAGDLVQKKTYTPDYLTHEKRPNTGQVPLIVIENHHEPIISRDLWNLTQERIKKRNKHLPGNSAPSIRYLFSGKIKCGLCGASFLGRIKYRKDGSKYRRWSCGTAVRLGTGACGIRRLVRDDDAMQMLKTSLRSLPVDRDTVTGQIIAVALSAIQSNARASEHSIQRIRSELKQTESKKMAVLDSFFSREITKQEMESMRTRYEKELISLRYRLSDAEKMIQQGSDTQTVTARMESCIRALLTGDGDSDVFYRTVLQDITVFEDGHMELRLHNLPHVFCFESLRK